VGSKERDEEIADLRRKVTKLERWNRLQEQQIQSLEQERKKLAAIVSKTDTGFFVLEADLRVKWPNERAREWFPGFTLTGSKGSAHCHDLLCGCQQVCVVCPCSQSLRRGRVHHLEQDLKVGGRRRHIYATAMPILDATGAPAEVMVMLQDFTDLKILRRSERSLWEAKQLAEQADSAKSTFLANMSHEIRTPMSGVIGLIELVMDTDLTDEQREYLTMIKISAESLLALLGGILDFSKINAGKLELETIAFPLRAWLTDSLSPLPTKEGVEVKWEVEKDVPDELLGDPHRLRQIVVNLVHNAVKFTDSGTVTVRAEARTIGPLDVELHLSVTDTGAGIPPEELESIFQTFSQTHGSSGREHGGVGLGLAICRQLAVLMRGKIWAESELGQGSTFHIELKLQRPAVLLEVETKPNSWDGDSDPTSLEMPAVNVANFGKRILVAEDNPINQVVVARTLETLGCKVEVVDNGADAVRSCEGTRYDLLLMDIQMPEMNGYEATAEIREAEGDLLHTPIVAMTALAVKGDREACLEAGMDDYLTKPVRRKELVAALKRWLE